MDRSRDLLIASSLRVLRGERTVLADVDLTLRRGELTVLLGPPGAGASTLLATLAGRVAPAGGAMTTVGSVVAALEPATLTRRSVRANLDLALRWWGVPDAERRRRADDALEAFGVSHLARRRASGLVGEEARRVHLARATAIPADVLLLDDPFTGLDRGTHDAVLADAAGVLRDPGRAALVAVRELGEARALADRLLVLIDGRVAAEGPIAEVLAHPPSAAVARFLEGLGAAPTT